MLKKTYINDDEYDRVARGILYGVIIGTILGFVLGEVIFFFSLGGVISILATSIYNIYLRYKVKQSRE